MTTETLSAHRRRFRGSQLDHVLGNALAIAAVALPPFVFGTWGLIQSLVFVNLFLVLSLFRTPDHDLPFGMAVRDIPSHVFTFGQTGTGMNSLVSTETQPEGEHHD